MAPDDTTDDQPIVHQLERSSTDMGVRAHLLDPGLWVVIELVAAQPDDPGPLRSTALRSEPDMDTAPTPHVRVDPTPGRTPVDLVTPDDEAFVLWVDVVGPTRRDDGNEGGDRYRVTTKAPATQFKPFFSPPTNSDLFGQSGL